MTTTQQPEAYKLAEELRFAGRIKDMGRPAIQDMERKAADELERLHGRVVELESQLEAIGADGVESLRKKQTMSDEQAMSIVSDAMQELGISFTQNEHMNSRRAHE